MPLPASWKTVTVTATFTRADTAGPAAGSVQFTPVKAVGIAADVVLPALITATLNGSGQISVALPCPNGAGVTSLVYEVIERVPGGRSYYIEIDSSMTSLGLESLPKVDTAPAPDWYATLEGIAGAAAGSASDAAASAAVAQAYGPDVLDRVEVLEISQGDGVPGVANYTDIAAKFPAPNSGQQVDVLTDADTSKVGRWGYLGGAWVKSADRVTTLDVRSQMLLRAAKNDADYGLVSMFLRGAAGFAYRLDDFTLLWQDTAGTVPVTAIGQTVKRITDFSGNGMNITNATGWVLQQDSRGCNYLQTDGASVFKCAIAWTGSDLTLAAAFNSMVTSSTDGYLVSLGTTANSTDWGGLRLTNTIGTARFVAAGALGTLDAFAESPGVPADPHVNIAQSQGASVYRDLTANAGTGSISNLASVNTLTIGALTRSIGSSFFASGRFYGAVGMPRNATATEREIINLWLTRKYGLTTRMFVAIGDSHTYNNSYGVTESDFYPRELARLLGDLIVAHNYGISGNTTGNIIARVANIREPGKPEFAVIYAGTNDNSGASTVQASPAPTKTSFSIASTIGARYGAGALITVGGVNAEVLSVAGDTITLVAPLASTPTAGQAVALRTKDNLVKIGKAMKAAGCDRILIPGLHYYNFASGLGDTTTTPSASAAGLRSAAAAAATELGAVYVDLYAWMRDLIIAGVYAQGADTAWHVAVGNAHLNATGEQILADAIYSAMRAQWWT